MVAIWSAAANVILSRNFHNIHFQLWRLAKHWEHQTQVPPRRGEEDGREGVERKRGTAATHGPTAWTGEGKCARELQALWVVAAPNRACRGCRLRTSAARS